MKWSTMNARDRRAVMLGAVVLLPGLVFIWGVRPYRAALERCARSARDGTRDVGARTRGDRDGATESAAAARRRFGDARDAPAPVRGEGRRDGELGACELPGRRRAQIARLAAGRGHASAVADVDGVRTLRVEIRAESDLARHADVYSGARARREARAHRPHRHLAHAASRRQGCGDAVDRGDGLRLRRRRCDVAVAPVTQSRQPRGAVTSRRRGGSPR